MGHTDHLLVVEDDRGIRELLADRLNRFEVTFAACQSDAYDLLRARAFDLVLLDLKLPRTPKDMRPANDVGIDILKEIRRRGLSKRGSTMPLPVVVMTAHGSEKLSAEILVTNGANDYIPKPFGTGQDLEHKIDRALAGEGALVPSTNRVTASVRIAFHPTDEEVRIETLAYRGAHHGLLSLLKDQYVRDLNDLLSFENFNGILGEEIAARLRITGKAARARVVKFRRQVKQDFREKLGRTIGDNDIVENSRNWKGYRLNPAIVRVVRWDQLVKTAP